MLTEKVREPKCKSSMEKVRRTKYTHIKRAAMLQYGTFNIEANVKFGLLLKVRK